MIALLATELPSAFVVGAHYDTFLQRALGNFFERATLESVSAPSPSSDGRLTSIRPMTRVSWRSGGSGTATSLRVPQRRPFTLHEVRFARAIGSVLQARQGDPQPAAHGRARGSVSRRHRGSLCRRVLRRHAYAPRANGGSERVAEVLEMMRVAALSSYENSPISTGVLLLEGDADPVGAIRRPSAMRRTIRAR